MKVNDPNLSGLSSSQIGGSHGIEPAGERQKRVEGGSAGARDNVSLSQLSSRIRELDPESPERAAYLERLSEAVQSGRYRVEAQEVSRKIVDDAVQHKE